MVDRPRFCPLPPLALRITNAQTPQGVTHAERPPEPQACRQSVRGYTELLDEARRLRINISETLESRLRTIVRSELERRWLEANKLAVEAYNQRVARDGLLADEAGRL